MKKTYSLLLLTFFALIFACNTHDDIVPDFTTTINGALIRTQVESFNTEELFFVVDFYVVNRGVDSNNLQLFSNYVTIDESNVSMQLGITENVLLETELVSLECSKDFVTTSPDALSVSLLIDQSGSVDDNDSLDLRVTAGKNIAAGLRPQDEMALMIFGGGFTTEVPEILVDFSDNPNEFIAPLENLANTTGGGTPLFEGLYETVLHTTENAKNQEKAVIVITDEAASDQGEQADSVICLANNSDVNIHIIKLGTANQNQLLNSLVVGTSGISMNVETAQNITSLTNFYDDFVSEQVYDFFYRSVWKTKRSWGDWEKGFYLTGRLTVEEEKGYKRDLPFNLLVCP